MALSLLGDPWQIVNMEVQISPQHDGREVSVNIYEANIEYGDGLNRVCKATAVNRMGNEDLIEIQLERFRQSSSLNPKYCILGHSYFELPDVSYFCDENYEHNLRSFMMTDPDTFQVKLVIKDFSKSLVSLHSNNHRHGNIKQHNLVIRNNRGFLAGGVGGQVFQCYFVKRNQRIRIEDPLEHDIMSFAEAIDHLCPRSHDAELSSLIGILKYHRSMDTLKFHPYLLNPTKRREFFIRAYDAFKKLGKTKKTGINAQYTSGITDWNKRVRARQDRKLVDCLDHKFPSSASPAKYRDNFIDLVRFVRNLMVHAPIDPGVSLTAHINALHSSLNGVCPNYAIDVYRACFNNFKTVGNVFV